MRWPKLARACRSFFFARVDLAPLAAFRVLFGLLVIGAAVFVQLNLETFFGSHAIVSPEEVAGWMTRLRLNLFLFTRDADAMAQALVVALALGGALLVLGLYTRASAVVVLVASASLAHRAPFFNGAYGFIRNMAFLLALSDAGRALSLRRATTPARGRAWPLRLMQLQVVSIYANTLLAKLAGGPWVQGTAAYYASRLVGYRRFALPYVDDHLWTVRAMSWGTLVVEGALATLLWNRRLRPLVIVLGVALHLGIEVTMSVQLFSYCMLASYVLFLEPETVRAVVARLPRWEPS